MLTKLFVVGTGRSGTHTLQKILKFCTFPEDTKGGVLTSVYAY